MSPDEEIIWKNIQRKDVRVFECYYRDHYKRFFLIAFKYLQMSEPAQEVINDVFLKLWENSETIVIEHSLKSYIYKSVINKSINILNKQKREIENQKELGFQLVESYEFRQIEENELKVHLYSAIDRLPEQCKRVFKMSRFDDLKQQEIADKLSISIKTVKNHITHALKHLNKSLRDFHVLLLLIIIKIFSGWL